MKRTLPRLTLALSVLFMCLLGLLCLAPLTGCTSMSKLAKELAKDPATVSIDVRSVYGTMTFRRSNASSNHSATVSADGSIVVDNIAGKPPTATEAILLRMVPAQR